MLTKKQNLLETIRGGRPDRFVNQYEAFDCSPNSLFGMIYADPVAAASAMPAPGGDPVKDAWGVTRSWPANVPGPFPVHDEAHKLLKDITKWEKTVKAPRLDYTQAEWDKFKIKPDEIDRNEVFFTLFGAPGIFEQLHYLMGMDDCLISFYEEPSAMKELIAYVTEWKLDYARLLCDNFAPEVIFQHDDWGSHTSSFLSPDMFGEFFLEPYKKWYGYYKKRGVQLIVHHNDAYSANLVPHMIEMQIDIWQGCVSTNNVSDLIKKYGGKISFMGDIDNGLVDREGWNQELIAKHVRRACEENGKHYFIPCITQGGKGSVYNGVYDAITLEIAKLSKELF
ncbi:MAG TPA: uroporphyrinogen decarboxylase family protein [Acidobacteriota bacterium]|nr:uroporphyrinogen decarboxylase family protein [Acidobacteriota bacterium]